MIKSILVTGGAGFIGSHLCKKLLDNGDTVFCLDNFFTGSKKNVEHLLKNPRFQMIEHDITEPLKVNSEVNEIYNLACPASPLHYQKDPIKTVKTNTLGVLHVLEYALSKKAKILQASTSEVYGDPLEHPQKETYWGNVNPIGPRSCYDEGKRVAETLFFDYKRQCASDIRVARIFNTYGPRMAQNDGRVVSNFIVQAITNQPITIYGDGSHTRSFSYVDDIVLGLIALMESNVSGPMNLGNPSYEFTILDLAKLIIKLTDSRSQITYRELPENDPQERRPDITLARAELQWEPLTTIEEGLQKTIEYFRQVM